MHWPWPQIQFITDVLYFQLIDTICLAASIASWSAQAVQHPGLNPMLNKILGITSIDFDYFMQTFRIKSGAVCCSQWLGNLIVQHRILIQSMSTERTCRQYSFPQLQAVSLHEMYRGSDLQSNHAMEVLTCGWNSEPECGETDWRHRFCASMKLLAIWTRKQYPCQPPGHYSQLQGHRSRWPLRLLVTANVHEPHPAHTMTSHQAQLGLQEAT